jgi:short-subunit dehydrogenase
MAVATPAAVVITGASSGIGEALAMRYARAGTVLGLIGRDHGRLEQVADRCRAAGSDVRQALIDVRERALLADWLREFDSTVPVDLLIANAGVITGARSGQTIEDAEAASALMEINVLGMLNTVQPIMPRMLARGRGQIAIMSSISALSPLPDACAYSASKAAVMSYGVALRDGVRHSGVRVNVLCPGFITSPMSSQIRGWKPMEMSAETAAKRIVDGLARDRAVIAFPWPLAFAARLSRFLPDKLRHVGMSPFRLYVAASQSVAETASPPRSDERQR